MEFRFQGFYDLDEARRLGTESMQLGVAVELCGPKGLALRHLQRGDTRRKWVGADRQEILAALARRTTSTIGSASAGGTATVI